VLGGNARIGEQIDELKGFLFEGENKTIRTCEELLMYFKLRSVFAVGLIVAGISSAVSAATLYSDNFNVDSSGSWTQNKALLRQVRVTRSVFACALIFQ
jgi:hypothetical protein